MNRSPLKGIQLKTFFHAALTKFLSSAFSEKGGSLLRKTMGIPDRTFKELFRDVKNKDAWSIWPMLMYPESRGYVRLKSADPMVYPAVQSNFFQDPLDLLRIVEGEWSYDCWLFLH
jgi:Choline dehydrogenase and related flavoproteins